MRQCACVVVYHRIWLYSISGFWLLSCPLSTCTLPTSISPEPTYTLVQTLSSSPLLMLSCKLCWYEQLQRRQFAKWIPRIAFHLENHRRRKGAKLQWGKVRGSHVLLSYVHNTKYIVGILQRGDRFRFGQMPPPLFNGPLSIIYCTLAKSSLPFLYLSI